MTATTRTGTRTGLHVAQPSRVLSFARQMATMPVMLQPLALLAFGLGTLARLIPDLDNGTLSNVIYALFSLPLGVSLLAARAVLSIEKAVLAEQATATKRATTVHR